MHIKTYGVGTQTIQLSTYEMAILLGFFENIKSKYRKRVI